MHSLRRRTEDLAAKVHAASTLPQQCVQLFKGLTYRLCTLHKRVNALEADIVVSVAHRIAVLL